VNGSSSYANGHIPGAIDFRANKDKIASLLGDNKDKLVVAYCGGPTCSAYQAGAKAAEEAGFKNIKHLSAGISGWLQAGKATEKADKKS
jgi:rhodanese-related sulfurtransferase